MSRMMEEIREQPSALERTLAGGLRRAEAFRKMAGRRRPKLVVLVARGTSDNAALFGRYLLELTTGIPVSLAAPSVYTLYGAKLSLNRALVIGVSQSGEGEDINHVLDVARTSGAYTVGITNEPSSSMVNLVDETLLMHGGREQSVAATKTFTGQMMLFYMLAAALSDAGSRLRYEAIPGYVADALDER